MSPEREPESVTLAEAAQRLGFSPKTFERWVEAGRIPYTVTAEGEPVFLLSDLRERTTRIEPAGPEDTPQQTD